MARKVLHQHFLFYKSVTQFCWNFFLFIRELFLLSTHYCCKFFQNIWVTDAVEMPEVHLGSKTGYDEYPETVKQ